MRASWLLVLVVAACTDPEPPVRDVGQPCRPAVAPGGGFHATESIVRRAEPECDDACLVHRHEGDLVPDDEETEAEIERNVYCTCACGNLVCGRTEDVNCWTCPEGFECCTLGEDATCGPGMVSDWCVREGTCP